MNKKYRFIISYICDNQPNSIEISSEDDSMEVDEAEKYIRLAHSSRDSHISDIRIVGLHRPNNPDVHPGHYQQPEG